MSLARGWLDTCIAEHTQCNIRARTPLPSRLVDVSNHRVRLVNTEGKEGAYLALSHCWGRNQIVQTKNANITERMEDIPWDLLSKTFKDAIIFTWKLGYRYIWIDSLVSHRQLRLGLSSFLTVLSVHYTGQSERLGNPGIANGQNIQPRAVDHLCESRKRRQ